MICWMVSIEASEPRASSSRRRREQRHSEQSHPTEGAVVTRLWIGADEVAWAGPPPTDALKALTNALAALGA